MQYNYITIFVVKIKFFRQSKVTKKLDGNEPTCVPLTTQHVKQIRHFYTLTVYVEINLYNFCFLLDVIDERGLEKT